MRCLRESEKKNKLYLINYYYFKSIKLNQKKKKRFTFLVNT